MTYRSLLTALGIAAGLVSSVASADPWCTTTYGFNARKMGYDAYIKANPDDKPETPNRDDDKKPAGGQLGAKVKPSTRTFTLEAGKYAAVTPIYIGRFEDTELPAPDYWGNDTGEVSFKLTKVKDESGYLNRLGATDRLGVSVHVCVYPKPIRADWAQLTTRETSPGKPNASVRLDANAAYGATSTAGIKGLINNDYVVVYLVRESMNFTGKFTLDVTATRKLGPRRSK